MSDEERVRIEWVDTAKGIGLILVMIGHCYLDRKYTFWFTSFHMALFFFLSGYTFHVKNESYLIFLKRKIKTLIVPYCFLALLTMTCEGLLAYTHGSQYEILKTVMLYIIQKRYTLLWYLTCLFLAENILYMILRNRRTIWRFNSDIFYLTMSIICAALFFTYKAILKLDLPWNADLALLATAFMLWGIYCRESECLMLFDNYWVDAIMLVICLAISTVQFMHFGAIDWYSNSFGNPLAFIIAATSGTFAVASFTRHIKLPIISTLGKNSLLFYGMHRIIIDLSFAVYGKLGISTNNGTPGAIILAVVSVVLAILVLIPCNWLIKKYCPWVLGRTCTR